MNSWKPDKRDVWSWISTTVAPMVDNGKCEEQKKIGNAPGHFSEFQSIHNAYSAVDSVCMGKFMVGDGSRFGCRWWRAIAWGKWRNVGNVIMAWSSQGRFYKSCKTRPSAAVFKSPFPLTLFLLVLLYRQLLWCPLAVKHTLGFFLSGDGARLTST